MHRSKDGNFCDKMCRNHKCHTTNHSVLVERFQSNSVNLLSLYTYATAGLKNKDEVTLSFESQLLAGLACGDEIPLFLSSGRQICNISTTPSLCIYMFELLQTWSDGKPPAFATMVSWHNWASYRISLMALIMPSMPMLPFVKQSICFWTFPWKSNFPAAFLLWIWRPPRWYIRGLSLNCPKTKVLQHLRLLSFKAAQEPRAAPGLHFCWSCVSHTLPFYKARLQVSFVNKCL